jgi:DNA-binding NtrC family response regulator
VQAGAGTEWARATVLVVDDDAAVRQLLADLLVSAGFEVVLADTGANLAEVVRQQHPDVVLLKRLSRDRCAPRLTKRPAAGLRRKSR